MSDVTIPRIPISRALGAVTQLRDPFMVGGNVPWMDCGWDFGPAPWKREHPRDWSAVTQELKELRRIGIGIVRWWILAGGLNYPVGGGIEAIAEHEHEMLGAYWRLKPGVEMPPLPLAFLADFESLCEACVAADVRLIPSLVSFEWFGYIDDKKRGRHELVFGRAGRRGPNRRAVSAFLDATLHPLLEASKKHRKAIFAWEPINEPDWAVKGGPIHPGYPVRHVSPAEMSLFIADSTQRIVSAGFTATVGFKDMHAPWLLPSAWRVLKRLARDGLYLHQMHHYPNVLGETTLPPASESPIKPVFVGEFPTAPPAMAHNNFSWKDGELGTSEDSPKTCLYGRIELIRRRGYAGAWLWATTIKDTRMTDERVEWDDNARGQVSAFVAGKVPP